MLTVTSSILNKRLNNKTKMHCDRSWQTDKNCKHFHETEANLCDSISFKLKFNLTNFPSITAIFAWNCLK